MENPIVLLIHGMGTHTDESIKEEFNSGLKQCMKFYGIDDFEAKNHFILDTFNYSEDWDEKRQEFADYLDGDIKDSLSLTPKLIQKIHGVISEFDGDDFLYTHVLDVLFYLTGVLREEQLVALANKLAKVIKNHVNDTNSGDLIVVAHSLGTSFIHDVLTQIYPNNLPPTTMGLDQLWSIATVSRLTHLITQKADPEKSIVFDNSSEKPGVCKKFYPVFNKYDPFCWFKRYLRAPNQGELLKTEYVRDLQKIYGDDEGMRINPHDFREYFADPEVGTRFLVLNGVLKGKTFEDFTKAKNKYIATTIQGYASENLSNIKKELETLSEDINGISGMKKKMDALLKVFDLIDEMRDEFKGG
jgi:hypothetical protein